MKYQQYLRLNRKLRRIKEAVHAGGVAMVFTGLVLFMLVAMAADSAPIGVLAKGVAMSLVLMGSGAVIERKTEGEVP